MSADRDGFFVIGCIFAAFPDFVFGSVFLYNTQKIPPLFMQLYKKLKNKKKMSCFFIIFLLYSKYHIANHISGMHITIIISMRIKR